VFRTQPGWIEEPSMEYQVRVENAEPRPIAVVRRRARPDQLAQVVPDSCGEVWQFLRAAQIPNTGLNLAVYLDGAINLDCGVLVLGPFTAAGSVVCSATPAGRVATTAHFGPYHQLGDAHSAITQWCAARHHRLAGTNWEIYGHWNDDPAQLRTDVYYLLA
jgi:effector-binding domain-containing protein